MLTSPTSLTLGVIAFASFVYGAQVPLVDDRHDGRAAAAPSPDTFKRVHLSHSGLHLGSPLSNNAPPFLSLFLDAPLYFVEDVKIRVSERKVRNWEEVHLQCGPIEGGSIEMCEKDDVQEAKSSRWSEQGHACKAAHVIPSESRLLIDAESCPALASLLDRSAKKEHLTSKLESVTLSFDVQRLVPVRSETHHFWLARLHRSHHASPDGGALWPFAGTANNRNDSTTTKYTGLVANRIDGLMQDPYLPRAAKPDSFDPLNGVDLTFASWANGIAIRVPSNSEHGEPDDPPFEPVHAPVSGQVVWMGEYTIARAPGNHRNDEHGLGLMIRDEWGMVYQILGLYQEAMQVRLGEQVEAGQHVGGASRTPLSLEPPCRHRPADPPKMDDKSRRYPLRFRMLRVLVARPDPRWHEWQPPFVSGWQYFNPLDAFTSAGRTNDVKPDPNPTQIFFAEPSDDGALTPPKIIATSNDVLQPPVLTGETEVIVGFDTFLNTPDDESDQLAMVALHAIDYAILPVSSTKAPANGPSSCDQLPNAVLWRTAFEHTKLPNAWTVSLPKTNLLAHYVPSFTVGSLPFFKTKYASQYDEKGRKLYYAPTRILVGQVDSRGAWDTRKEPNGNGVYQIWVRGRDWFGNQGCIGANVRIRNGA